MSKARPIGLLGGAFDPVHTGHIHMALDCIKTLDLEEVRFIPAHIPPHKAATAAPPSQRLAMLELALRPHPRLTISAIELERGGVSYTIDTLVSLRADAPQQPFCFILGADAFASLPRWHRWQALADQAHLVIIDRKGQEAANWSPQLQDHYQQRACASPDHLHARPAGCIHRAAISVPAVSSSQARALLSENGNTEQVLPPGVDNYIKEHRLYT